MRQHLWTPGAPSSGRGARALRLPAGRLVLAANHCQFYTTTFQATGANHVRAETRTRHKTGNADLTQLRLVYAGFYLANGTGIETNVGNAVSIEAAIEWPGATPVTARVTFNGSSVGSIVDGATAYMSDPIYPSAFGLSVFPKNTTFYVRRLSAVAQTLRYGRHEASSATGERTAFSDGLSASQLLGSGAMAVPSGGADSSATQGPTAILGVPSGTPDIAVALIGDSITNGSNDNNMGGDGEAGSGWMPRGLWSVGSRSIPWIKMAVGGAEARYHASNVKWKEYLQYVTHGIVAAGTNDMRVSSRTAAQTWADLQTLYTACKTGGLRRVEAALIIPRVTGTYATTGGQTPVTGFETGGNRRDALNTLIVAGTSGLDNYINVNLDAADGTALDRFIANGTNDGTHPVATLHASMGSRLATRAATWS
jgi:hypothetical protein